MTTTMEYLNNTYQFESDAIITNVSSDEKGDYIELDTTLFYPQGGGQPCDKGKIYADNKIIDIVDVRFIDGNIRHYISSVNSLTSGKQVHLKVNEERRLLNAEAHTAGHLIQAVVEDMNLGLKAVKGYHFPEGSYVQFVGEKPADVDKFISQVNEKLKSAILNGQTIEVRMVNGSELKKMCPNLPYEVPSDKPLRVVKIGQLGSYVPCGGTHLSDVKMLRKIKVTKVKFKKGDIKISYCFEWHVM